MKMIFEQIYWVEGHSAIIIYTAVLILICILNVIFIAKSLKK